MTRDALIDEDWDRTVERLGGARALAASALETRAFVRPREVRSAVDLLRLTLAYCLSHMGLRTTAAWAATVGLAQLSDVGLLLRLRNVSAWLSLLVGQLLESGRPAAASGRLIRILDATTVTKAGREARSRNCVWRIHSAFDLPAERFGFLAVTDEHGGERLDRVPVVPGEIRIGDRGYAQADQIAAVMADGADVLVRAGWRGLRWLDQRGEPLDLLGLLAASRHGLVDRPVWIARKSGAPLAVRLVAQRLPASAVAAARRKTHQQSRKEGRQASAGTLAAAEWLILVTSLPPATFTSDDIYQLYRMRWRIELAFKRLKSLIGLRSPPAQDPRLARSWVLSHLIMVLLTEPVIDELGVSPR